MLTGGEIGILKQEQMCSRFTVKKPFFVTKSYPVNL
jgi:hypothetical protein